MKHDSGDQRAEKGDNFILPIYYTRNTTREENCAAKGLNLTELAALGKFVLFPNFSPVLSANG